MMGTDETMKKDLILAVDGSGQTSVAAIGGSSQETVFAYGESGGTVANVYSSVDQVFHLLGCDASNVKAVVVNTGPGSWSRTRIAVVYSCGIAFSTSIQVYGMTGFAIARKAYSVRKEKTIELVDQIGNSIWESATESSDKIERPSFRLELFPEIKPEKFLCERRMWLNAMIQYGNCQFSSGKEGDPTLLSSTYYQEFQTSIRATK